MVALYIFYESEIYQIRNVSAFVSSRYRGDSKSALGPAAVVVVVVVVFCNGLFIECSFFF